MANSVYGSSSQDISSKRASPGLLIGCTIDTSTSVLSFVSVLVVRTVTWYVPVTYSRDTAAVARISHQNVPHLDGSLAVP